MDDFAAVAVVTYARWESDSVEREIATSFPHGLEV